jgi:quercetin dioxygenase-like cupin family protein
MSDDFTADWIELAPGVKRMTCAVGENMMQMIVRYEKGAKAPEHSHVNEQIAAVLSGKMRLIIGGEPHELSQGESVVMRGSVPHSAEALEESWVLDTFTPLREDLLKQDGEWEAKLAARGKA